MLSHNTMGSSPLLNVMIMAIEKVGRALVRDFGEIEQLQVSRKSLGEFISTADRRSEKMLCQELKKARPRFGLTLKDKEIIEGEDSTQRWIINPLDGGLNFLHGIPHCAITIALECRQEIVAGVVFNPLSDELYWAEKGKGAFLNRRRLRVSGRKFLDEALVATGGSYTKNQPIKDQVDRLAHRITPLVSGVRRFGCPSLDLAFVAAGRYEGYFDGPLHIWDMAAGAILIREAGGYLSDLKGDKDFLTSGHVLAGNEPIFNLMKPLAHS